MLFLGPWPKEGRNLGFQPLVSFSSDRREFSFESNDLEEHLEEPVAEPEPDPEPEVEQEPAAESHEEKPEAVLEEAAPEDAQKSPSPAPAAQEDLRVGGASSRGGGSALISQRCQFSPNSAAASTS